MESCSATEPGSSAGTRPRSATNPPASASRPSAISAISSGVGSWLEALERSKRPLVPGFDRLVADLEPRARSPPDPEPAPEVIASRSSASFARAAASPGSAAPCAADALAGASAPLALVRAAGDGRADDLLAVAVLGQVGRQVVARLAQVGVRVGAAECAVVGAVADHLPRVRRCRGRARQAPRGRQARAGVVLLGSQQIPPGCPEPWSVERRPEGTTGRARQS